MKWVFVSMPLRAKTFAGVYDNIEQARAVGQMLVECGYMPIVPHMLLGTYSGILSDEAALETCKILIEKCSAVYAPCGTEDESEGCRIEREWAESISIPVVESVADID